MKPADPPPLLLSEQRDLALEAGPEPGEVLRRSLAGLDELARLTDALSRDHPVWRFMAVQTLNIRRVEEFALRLRREEPDHEAANWALLALDWLRGGSGFDASCWRGLERRGDFDLVWPIAYGYRYFVLFGWSASLEELGSYLQEPAHRAPLAEAIEQMWRLPAALRGATSLGDESTLAAFRQVLVDWLEQSARSDSIVV